MPNKMNIRIIRSSQITAVLCALFCAFAASSTFAAVSSMSWQPAPVDLHDLDHRMLYTWRIDDINVAPSTITSASITFTNIANWNNSANVLHMHLLDTAKGSGVRSFQDDYNNNVTDLTDDFINTRFHNDPNWLVANGTADTFLKDKSFGTTPTTYTYNFSSSELSALQQYLANGKDIALGFDPDCHYFNDGITFTLNFTPVPEVANLLPIALMIAVALGIEIRRRRRVPALAKVKI